MEYMKISSLWKRQGWYFDQDKKKSPDYQAGRQSFIVGDYAEPEFASIKKWRVEEKIDGTNIRVFFEPSAPNHADMVSFGGRTSKADIPKPLLAALNNHFTADRLLNAFPDANQVILFGEGYGPKIQACGGNYRSDPGFILFDVLVGNWWLKREDVHDLADKLEIPHAPDLGIMTEDEIVEFVKSRPPSRCSRSPQIMEGIIARSHPLLLFRNGKPLMWKLKCKEFKKESA